AISILSRPPPATEPNPIIPRVEYAELLGSRAQKLAAFEGSGEAVPSPAFSFQPLEPTEPHWRLVPTAAETFLEYDAGWSLAAAMPVSTSAPVTARDHFLVAFSPEELHERIAEFRDLAIPDE